MNSVNKTLYIPLYGKSYVSKKGLFLDDKKAVEIKALAKGKNFPVSGNVDKVEKSSYNEEELTALFESLAKETYPITPSFAKHYNQWLEYMFLSFIATAGKITVIENPVANEQIGKIIKSLNEAI